MKFADYLVPSGGLMHNMTDEQEINGKGVARLEKKKELLWRASMEPRRVDARMPDRVVPRLLSCSW
jgi:hypothetical protein